jgi:alpha-glucosidase
MRSLIIFSSIILFSAFGSIAQKRDRPIEIASPNGVVKVTFLLKNGIPNYRVSRSNVVIINDSRLGFILKDLPALDKDFKIASSSKSSFDETWTQPWGEVKTIRNKYNSLTLTLEEQASLKRKMIIEFRVYNDGLGFRYEIPRQKDLEDFVIMDELTEFAVAQDITTWWIPAYSEDMDSECLYRQTRLSDLKEKTHTPITLSSDKLYISIHEAALVDYAGMTLFNQGSLTLKCDLVPWSNGNRVEVSAPLKTPWRTIQLADDAGDLLHPT